VTQAGFSFFFQKPKVIGALLFTFFVLRKMVVRFKELYFFFPNPGLKRAVAGFISGDPVCLF